MASVMMAIMMVVSCTGSDRELPAMEQVVGKSVSFIPDAVTDDGKRPSESATPTDKTGKRHVKRGCSAVVSAEGVTLFIDSGSVRSDVEIAVVKTDGTCSGAIPAHMENLTAGSAVYRMLPDGQRFERDITIAMRYDSAALPYGYSAEDIYTFFYNERTGLWQQIERDSVDTLNQIVYSRTNHFTDYINGVLKVPESSDAMAYTPTSIKELKAADPMEGVTMIAPPEANNMGTANLTYPLTVPAGRRGMQPRLTVNYNSAGGSGILGLGWNLPISEISVDTRRGVPLFDQTYETEAYVYDGEEIVTSYLDNNGMLRLNKPVHKTAWRERDATLDTMRYYHRREGSFSRIQRVNTTTKTYSWIVTDKTGTKFYYGVDADSRLCDGQGNITRWLLSYVEDTYGNTCTYHWAKRTFTHPSLNPGVQVLLQSVNYTGKNSEPGHYDIRFYYSDSPKHDATVSARSGVMEADAFLLDHIDETFDGTPIRSYYFGYKQGSFSKTLLCNIVEASPKTVEDGGLHCSGTYSHTSNPLPEVLTEKEYPGNSRYTRDSIIVDRDFYTDDFRILNSVGEPIFSREVYARCAVSDEKCEYYTFNEHRFEYTDLPHILLGPEGLIFNHDTSEEVIEGPLFMVHGTPGSIEGSGTRSWNVGGGLDVGFGYNTSRKNITLGGNYSYTNNTTEGLLSLADLNGDGLPDKVYKRGGKCYYRLLDPDNISRFGAEKEISDISDFLYSTSNSHTWGVEGSLGADNGVNFGVNWTHGTDMVRDYLSDVDGDGLPDLVRDGNVYYNRIHQYPDKVFVEAQSEVRYDTLSVCGDIVVDTVYVGEPVIPDLFDSYDNDTVYYTICRNIQVEHKVGDSCVTVDTVVCYDTMVVNSYRAPEPYFPNLENVRLWKAPYAGFVTIGWDARIVPNTYDDGDGVRLIVQKDTAIIHDRHLRPWEQIRDTVGHVYVEQGSRIFFRMLSGESRTADRALWNPTIRYENVTTPGVNLNDSIGSDGLNRFVYSYDKDFMLSGVQHLMMPYQSRIRLTSKASVGSTCTITMPILYTVLVNGQSVRTDSLTNTRRTISVDFHCDVEKHDEVQIRMTCGHPINWGAVEAQCRLRIVENRSTDFSDKDIVCMDTQSLPGDTIYFYDCYPQIEKQTGVVPGQQDAIFGTMYRQWGQFAYKSPDGDILMDTSLLHLDSIYHLEQSDSTSYTDISEGEEINVSGNGEESSVSIGGRPAYNPLASAFFHMQPDFMNGCWSAYTDYASVGRDTLSNVPHPASAIPQGQYDSSTHVSVSQTYSPGAYAVTKRNRHSSWGVSANGHVNMGMNTAAGGSHTRSETRQLSDMIDLNGDGLPDVLSETKVQYSQPQGGLSSHEGRHSINRLHLDSTFAETTGGSFSGSAVFHIKLPAQNPRRARSALSCNVGATLNGMSTSGKTIVSWSDINGDGLPDKIADIDDTLHYFQNLGYCFMGERRFGSYEGVRESYSLGSSGGASLGLALEHEWLDEEGLMRLRAIDSTVASYTDLSDTDRDSVRQELLSGLDSLKYSNRLNVSLSAGMNTSVSDNSTPLSYMDFNGDGLPDRLEKYNNGYIIKFNSGNDFGGGMAVLLVDSSEHLSVSTDLSAAITVGFTIGTVPLKMVVNPKGGMSRSLNSTKAQWMDMNADGIPDYIWSAGNGTIGVRYSNLGLANRLQRVTLPSKGTYDIAYTLNNDGPGSCSNHYVMSELAIADNRMSTPVQHRTFRYVDRHYDRRERDDYGYSVVETSEDETLTGQSGYRTTCRHYLNGHYLFRGLCDTVRVSRGDTVYTQSHYYYNLMDISSGQSIGGGPGCHGDGYPALEHESAYYYIPGNRTPVIETYRGYEYGPFGNLSAVYEDGDVNDPDDDFTAVSLFDSVGDYIVSAVVGETVSGNGVLRHRTATYNSKGDVDTLRFSIDSDGDAEYVIAYDDYGNVTSVTHPANHQGQRYTISYDYDSVTHALPIKVANSYGLSSATRYDFLWQKPVLSVDANGAHTEWRYDDKGRTVAVYAPFEYGSTTPTAYYDYADSSRHNCLYWDSRHRMAYTMNHNNGSRYIRTTTISDGLGRPRVVKRDAEVNGSPCRVVSGWKDFDGLGRVAAQWEPTVEELNADDTITSRPNSTYCTRYSHDVLDRVTMTLYADSTVTMTDYGIEKDATDTWRLLVRTTDQNGHVTKRFYDTRGLVTTTVGAVGESTVLYYDAFGQLVKSRDPDGDSVMHFYDNMGRRTHRIHPSAGHTRWLYDAAGNMIRQTQNDGQHISYTFDYCRPVAITYSDCPWNNVWLKYGTSGTEAGRVVAQQDASGVQEFRYDEMGNVTFNRHSFVQPHSPEPLTLTTRWAYDSWGRVTNITYPDREKVGYKYDSGGLLCAVDGFKAGHAGHSSYIRQILYDHFGQRVRVTDGDSIETAYTYNPANRRLVRMTNRSLVTGDTLQDNSYHYDAVGNIDSIRDNGRNPRMQNFVYDEADRLVQSEGKLFLQADPALSYSYKCRYIYSPAGRLLNKHVDSRRLGTSSGTHTVRYDNNYYYDHPSNPYAVTHIQDAFGSDFDFEWTDNGNLGRSIAHPANTRRHFCWTEDNRLQTFLQQGGEGTIAAYYNYTADGERNIKLVSPCISIQQNATQTNTLALIYPTLYASPLFTLTKHGYTKHYFEEGRRICSKIGGGLQGKVTASEVDSLVRPLAYTYEVMFSQQHEGILRTFNGCAGAEPQIVRQVSLRRVLAVQETQRDASEPAFFYHGDHLGSAAYLTSGGHVTQTLNYLPYGEDWVESNHFNPDDTTRLGIYRFNGKEKDHESGLHYYGARYYWSEALTGWLSVDPMTDKYPNISSYAYCAWNPVKMVDPDGLTPRVYIENVRLGHAFVSVECGGETIVYTYGRYLGGDKNKGRLNSLDPFGKGVLIKLTGDDAKRYINHQINNNNASIYEFHDASDEKVIQYYESLFASGTALTPNEAKQYNENQYNFGTSSDARVIDQYYLLGNNCVSKSIEGIKKGGTVVSFSEHRFFPMESLCQISPNEIQPISPAKLKKYLDQLAQNNLNVIKVSNQNKDL